MGYSSPNSYKHEPSAGPIQTEAGLEDVLGDRDENEKTMEESTTVTAPTLVTGHSHGIQAEEDDATTIRSQDSIGGRGMSSLGDLDDHHETFLQVAAHTAPLPVEALSTCSVSTAPSTDEASSMGGIGEWLQYSTSDAGNRVKQPHRRTPSWEASPHSQYPASTLNLPPSYSPSTGWQQQQHFATFRNERNIHPSGTPPRPRELPYLPRVGHTDNRNMFTRPASYAYPQQQRRQFHGPPLPPSTPPRAIRSKAAPPTSPHRGPSQNAVATGPRSSSEVLKTLLRKKACLYEPDTSRAVALVTWLVGRELALQQGFFSRQQLQSGVHACVGAKIDSGVITRTKVNRCMQIILNSCFHYIIPRPDGSEEDGSSMRNVFAEEMYDDSFMLTCLPAPWNDLSIDIDFANDDISVRTPTRGKFETPKNSPRFGSVQEKDSPSKESVDGEESATKRAVLLCFNENVRSAADVFRCHNEFIRDTAHSSNLQLSSNEWRQFFGMQASSAPQIWANIGIPVPSVASNAKTDALGMFTAGEAALFRTTWCSKRYEHDHSLCGFAHAEINSGWLRRNPSRFSYTDEMCQFVAKTTISGPEGPSHFILNVCPNGKECDHAHSHEEVAYHPRRYKSQTCGSAPCSLCEVCPRFHAWETYRFPRKSDGKSQRRQGGHAPTKSGHCAPASSPIVVSGMAPLSSFEDSMLLPGLREIYRTQSNLILSLVKGEPIKERSYSLFGFAREQEAPVSREEDEKIVGVGQTGTKTFLSVL